MPSVAPAFATGEHLMGNIFPFCDVKCQNITAWAWRALELSVAVNSGAGEALPGAWERLCCDGERQPGGL